MSQSLATSAKQRNSLAAKEKKQRGHSFPISGIKVSNGKKHIDLNHVTEPKVQNPKIGLIVVQNQYRLDWIDCIPGHPHAVLI